MRNPFKRQRAIKVEKVLVEEPVEDRSAFNCSSCKGSGLKNERERCDACLGTGKV